MTRWDSRYTADDAQKSRSLTLPHEFGGYGTSPLGSLGLAGKSPPGDYSTLGAFSIPQAQYAWDRANYYARQTIPAPVRAAINASSLSSKQKALLLREPLGIAGVVGDFAADQAVSFITRVQKMASTNATYYNVGGRRIPITKSKTDALKLGMSMMVVSYAHPIQAHVVAAQMAIELGNTSVKMLSAGVQSYFEGEMQKMANIQSVVNQAAQTAQNAAQAAGQTLQQAVQAGQEAAEQTVKSISSWFGLGTLESGAVYAGFGDGGVLSGPLAAFLTSLGVDAEAATLIAVCVEAGIASAPVWVPMIWDLINGQEASPPTEKQKSDEKIGAQNLQQIAPKSWLENFSASLGTTPGVVVAGGVVTSIGLAFILTRKK